MEQWAKIRRRVLNEGESKRQILRETGMHWLTLEKILTYSCPPGYRESKPRPKPKIGQYLVRIAEIIESDKSMKKKYRHTAKRIYERLVEEGYQGRYTQVKEAVREIKRVGREVYIPLVHDPGEAQVDYFEALAKMRGVLRKVAVFAMALPYSDAFFLMAFERECTESFWEGHVRAFEFFGGVPHKIAYDNLKIAVKAIVGSERSLTDGFLRLASHYLFDYHFCRVRRANEKGVVENTVKYARCNFMVPVPDVSGFAELNERLLDHCRSDLSRRLRGRGAPKELLLADDQAAFLPLPEGLFDACVMRNARSNSLSLVRFKDNDYSIPVKYAYHDIVVKGYVDRVEICRGPDVIAIHERIWDKEKISYDPRHYLQLLERKPGALDYARPLKELQLPECFDVLRRRLESGNDGKGTREYIGVLRLLEKHSVKRLASAIEKALGFGAPSRDVIGMYLYPDQPTELGTFILDGRPQLKGVTVGDPDLSGYADLLPGEDRP
jgi:transposase